MQQKSYEIKYKWKVLHSPNVLLHIDKIAIGNKVTTAIVNSEPNNRAWNNRKGSIRNKQI